MNAETAIWILGIVGALSLTGMICVLIYAIRSLSCEQKLTPDPIYGKPIWVSETKTTDMNNKATDEEIAEIKQIRVEQQKLNDRIKKLVGNGKNYGAEITIARRKGQEVRHWLGEALGIIRQTRPDLQHPYPDGDNPENNRIAPAADTEN